MQGITGRTRVGGDRGSQSAGDVRARPAMAGRSPRRLPGPFVLLVVSSVAMVPAVRGQSGDEASSPPTSLSSAAVAGLREAAVRRARAGDVRGGLAELEALHRRAPEDADLLWDLAVVRTWAGERGKALALLERIDLEQAPPYVLAALARAARDERRFALAAELYARWRKREPASVDAVIGHALAKAEGGEIPLALSVLRRLEDRLRGAGLREGAPSPGLHEAVRARAWVLRLAGRHLEAAALYRLLLDERPSDPELQRLLVLSTADAGASHLAAELADRYRSALPPSFRARILADRAAMQIRWAEQTPAEPPERFREHERALRHLDTARRALEELAPAAPDTEGLERRLAFDRMVALRDRRRMAEVLALYDALLARGISPPDYALEAAADALLYLERPEDALRLYRDLHARHPERIQSALGVFYALVDLDRHEEAGRLIEALRRKERPWRLSSSRRIVRENRDKLALDHTAAMARAFADDLADAQKRLEALRALGPRNTDLRTSLATVYRWRGWTKRARRIYAEVAEEEPTHLEARLGLAGAAMESQRFPEAEARLGRLLEDYPEHRGVRSLARTWSLHGRPVLETELVAERSSVGTVAGSASLQVITTWWSRPWRERYRAFVRDRFTRAELAEGSALAHRLIGGLERRSDHFTATLEASAGLRDHTGSGLGGRLRWWSDHWRLDGRLESNSVEVPIRARWAGVRAWGVELGGGYRWHESQEAAFSFGYLDYDDGNEHLGLGARLVRRLLSTPHFKLDAEASLDGGWNDRSDVPYFSPASQASAVLGGRARVRLHQRYRRRASLELEGGAGTGWQEGFGSDPIWHLGISLELEFSDTARLSLGARRARRVFDGVPELDDALSAALRIVF